MFRGSRPQNPGWENVPALLNRLRSGADDGTAARILDAHLRPRLLRYFRTHSVGPEDAEDLVQKTLTAVFLNVGRLEDEQRVVGWLFAIARNAMRDERDRRSAERRVIVAEENGTPEPAAPSEGGGPEERIEAERRVARLRRALAELPARQRQCLVLRTRDELRYEEIAKVLQLSVLTVRNHIAEGTKALRRKLNEANEGSRE